MGGLTAKDRPIVWAPQPGPQTHFVNSPVFEVCYGGARGGGKTDATIGDFAIHAQSYGRHAKGLLARRTLTALLPTIERAKAIYGRCAVDWNESHKRFTWPNGAVLYCRYLERDADADAYQGHDYSRVYVEELTQFPDPSPVDKLKATLRSAVGVPCGFRATCNPGGPGHTWVKARYIDVGPYTIIREEFENPFDHTKQTLSRVFIPARLDDNPRLLENDPLYVARLHQVGSDQLVKAWLEGDWSIIEGAFFDNWRASRNVVRPFEIPDDWLRFCSLDWGSARPFSVGWWAVAGDPHRVGAMVIPRGCLVRYREWYGSTGKPNEGLKMTAEKVAEGIKERELGEPIAYRVADTGIFDVDGGPSIGERMYDQGVLFGPADKRRLNGWDQMRARIGGDEIGPQLVVFSSCRDFIRTVPVLQHDAKRAEDIDTEAEDHAADEARYACMSRPYVPPKPKSAEPIKTIDKMTFDDVIALHERRQAELD